MLGRNHVGQLGDGSVLQRLTPAGVATLTSGVTSLRAGSYHNCVVRDTGALLCWGYNANYQLGNGTVANSLLPIAASNVSGTIRQLALGGEGSCVVLDDGEGLCWGANTQGRFGNGSLATPLAIPQAVAQWLQHDLIFRSRFDP